MTTTEPFLPITGGEHPGPLPVRLAASEVVTQDRYLPGPTEPEVIRELVGQLVSSLNERIEQSITLRTTRDPAQCSVTTTVDVVVASAAAYASHISAHRAQAIRDAVQAVKDVARPGSTSDYWLGLHDGLNTILDSLDPAPQPDHKEQP